MKRDLPSPYAKQALRPDVSDGRLYTTPSPEKYRDSPFKRNFRLSITESQNDKYDHIQHKDNIQLKQ